MLVHRAQRDLHTGTSGPFSSGEVQSMTRPAALQLSGSELSHSGLSSWPTDQIDLNRILLVCGGGLWTVCGDELQRVCVHIDEGTHHPAAQCV